MSARQFAASLDLIRRTEHRNRGVALARHLYWQARKLAFPRPVRLTLSRSVITDDEPGGVISLVNMLGCYDYNNMHFVQRVLAAHGERSPVFVDVGANIGAYTLIASESPGVRVLSLEPIPAAYAKLRHNVAANGRENVVALNLGASDRAATLTMTCDRASVFNQVIDGEGEGMAGPTMEVQVDRVDALCSRLGLVPTLMKVDVEGHEPAVLLGAEGVLAGCLGLLVERGERPGIVGFLRALGLEGPFYYRHEQSLLSDRMQRVAEDSVFIGPGFAAALPQVRVGTAAPL